MSVPRHCCQVHATPLGAEIRKLLRSLQYAPCYIAAAVDHIGIHGTCEGSDSIEAEDLGAVEDLVIRHTGAVESDPSLWPAWTDAEVWNPTAPEPEPEPFTPSPEDRSWAALTFSDARPVRVRPGDVGTPQYERQAALARMLDRVLDAGGGVSDWDMANSGACG